MSRNGVLWGEFSILRNGKNHKNEFFGSQNWLIEILSVDLLVLTFFWPWWVCHSWFRRFVFGSFPRRVTNDTFPKMSEIFHFSQSQHVSLLLFSWSCEMFFRTIFVQISFISNFLVKIWRTVVCEWNSTLTRPRILRTFLYETPLRGISYFDANIWVEKENNTNTLRDMEEKC